jgi:two-component system, sensor histidine kinase PdtaS
VSNALKHGFTDQQKGTIVVDIRPLGDQHVELSISDDGKGIPEELDLMRTGSLGLQLVNLLTSQLHGQLEIQRAKPTRFALRFKLGVSP